jgi:hypothetical protein
MSDTPGPKDYVMMRVPTREYEKIQQAREQLQQSQNYDFVRNLAVGAFVGFLAGWAINELTKPAPRRRATTRRRSKKRAR